MRVGADLERVEGPRGGQVGHRDQAVLEVGAVRRAGGPGERRMKRLGALLMSRAAEAGGP